MSHFLFLFVIFVETIIKTMMNSTDFSRQVMPHSRKMFAVAYRFLQRPEEAEDVLQDAMVKLWQNRDSLPPEKELLPYLLTVVRNLSIDRLRSKERVDDNIEVSDITTIGIGDSPLSTDDGIEEKDRLRHMLGLINQLPPDQQKVLKLKVFDDLTTEEIAKRMNIQPENVRQLLSRARKKLRELAQKQGLI